ncbi:glycosyltransferase family 4 protein [Kerstersia gyiorum]|uniref:glycosyltransferase family 4 protein n=1 Tax=Kerstersia gyiorum TaxID=206506 RepID=UPI000A017BA5|nr:glycosyltransferase family 4 protein [Kerstersia gyiorum]
MSDYVFLNPTFYPNIGGAENSIFEMAQSVSRCGMSSIIVCSNINKANKKKLLDFECLSTGIDVIRYDASRICGGYLQCITILKKIRNSSKADVVVIARNHLLVLCARLAGFKRVNYMVPSVVAYQDHGSFKRFFSCSGFRYIFHCIGQCLAFWCSSTYAFSDVISRQIKISSLKISSPKKINPGINLNRFSTPTQEERIYLRKKYNIKENAVVLLAVGRFVPLKQFDVAIRVLGFMDSMFILVLVGGGPEFKKYQELVSDLNLTDRVRFIDATNNPVPFYQLADTYLMTSRYETFGQVILEALACGVDVVAFGKKSGVNTATEDIIRDCPEIVGIVDEISPSAMAAIITTRIVGDVQNRRLKCRTFLNKYTWENTIKNIRENG